MEACPEICSFRHKMDTQMTAQTARVAEDFGDGRDSPASDDPATRPQIALLPGAHRRAESGHPWIYSNEIAMDAAAKALPPAARDRTARRRAARSASRCSTRIR